LQWHLPGKVTAATPETVDPADFDLIALAMQEPQYQAPAVKALMGKIAAAKKPCLSIMNMPPLSYLQRIPALKDVDLTGCYADPTVWDGFEPGLVSLCSPDPQAFRPPEEKANVLHVGLPTNLWSMLLTGNYRCVTPEGVRPIQEAVHGDVEASRQMYAFVDGLAQKLGADPADQVPFEKYANAANGLLKPSSAARAIDAGATQIERVDKVVQTIAASMGMSNPDVDQGVETVDMRLSQNTKANAA